jgi:hypothetical protein
MCQLGYVTPIVLSSNTTGVSIPAIENLPTVYKLWTFGSPLNEYFLVSNRQLIGYDSALPYQGLLIWHIDDNVPDYGANDDEWYPGHTAYGHYKVALEQSDGLWKLESTIPFGFVNYSGHPYPGVLGNRDFHGGTLPNSRSYGDAETWVAVSNISDPGAVMTCDLFVSPSDVEDEQTEKSPNSFSLKQNYPNPFNPLTRIEYWVPRRSYVKLEIFNVLGEKIKTLVDGKKERGLHTVNWDGTSQQGIPAANGIYLYQLQADEFVNTNKMILLK